MALSTIKDEVNIKKTPPAIQKNQYPPEQQPTYLKRKAAKNPIVPAYDSPTHKLMHKGAESLSDAEILSLFMNENVELARHTLLFNLQSLRELFRAQPDEFEVLGINQETYVQLQAVLELSRRHLKETVSYGDIMSDPDSVKAFLTTHLRECRSELFCALFLNTRHQLITFKTLFTGTIDGASVYPREVVRKCIEHNAKAVIFAHNHPSGIAEPSQSDERITQRLRSALELIDVNILDHFIVGETVTSMVERGLM